jgi:predicted transposase/invertase (TIGR01784 family)
MSKKGVRASDYYEILLKYIFHISSPEQYEQILKVLQAMDKKVGEMTMTAFDVLMSRGMAKGMQKSTRELAKRMLEKGISAETVMEITGLSPETLNSDLKNTHH